MELTEELIKSIADELDCGMKVYINLEYIKEQLDNFSNRINDEDE